MLPLSQFIQATEQGVLNKCPNLVAPCLYTEDMQRETFTIHCKPWAIFLLYTLIMYVALQQDPNEGLHFCGFTNASQGKHWKVR